MRTVKDIQQEVLATAQVTLDELRASIEKFWEQGWSTYQEALSLYKSSAWYIHNHELRAKDYESIKRLYTMIAEGTTPNCVGELPDEAKKADARKRLEENEERYPKSIQTVENTALRRQYYSLCGYTHEDEIVWDRTKPSSYRNHPSIKKNEELQKSGILNLFFYCKSREEFEAKRESEVKFIIAAATAKLMGQVEKKLAPIKDEIQSFDLISFHGQQGNYVGEWVVITAGSRYLFKTSCILAGGYNIQCLHARYIAHLKQLKK